MARVLIVESNSADLIDPVRAAGGKTGADHYADGLRVTAPDLRVEIVAPYVAPFDTARMAEFDGIAFTGSGVAWSVDAPEGAPLRAVMEAALATGKPIVASCNGMQLGALVLGGRIGASPNGFELGLARDVTLTRSGRAHPMMTGRRDVFSVPCIHRDEVQVLPAGADLLAGNAHSPIQAFAYERGGVDFWGVQYHPELPAATIAGYLSASRGLFQGNEDIAGPLAGIETDEVSAARLGTSTAEMSPRGRTVELANWVRRLP